MDEPLSASNMNSLGIERRRKIKRTSVVATLAAMATGGIVLGPHPSVAADLMHNAFGKDNAVERTVEHVAEKIYGTKIFAHCAPTHNNGQASLIYRTVRLNPWVCKRLGGIIANPAAGNAYDGDNAKAILTVAHELSHIDGAGLGKEGNEGVTQCLGVQRSQQVAQALGVPADKAKIIGDMAAATANFPARPEYTIPVGCVDGGQYDIDAPGSHFPSDPIEAYINGDNKLGSCRPTKKMSRTREFSTC